MPLCAGRVLISTWAHHSYSIQLQCLFVVSTACGWQRCRSWFAALARECERVACACAKWRTGFRRHSFEMATVCSVEHVAWIAQEDLQRMKEVNVVGKSWAVRCSNRNVVTHHSTSTSGGCKACAGASTSCRQRGRDSLQPLPWQGILSPMDSPQIPQELFRKGLSHLLPTTNMWIPSMVTVHHYVECFLITFNGQIDL